MELLDRYLAAIGRELPRAQAADITAELRDNLLSEIEEKEQGLGRSLTREELEAVLIGFGHPFAVAGRYRKIQQLIGPEMFPFWWATLRVIAAIAFSVWLAGLVVRASTSGLPPGEVVGQGLSSLWTAAILMFGTVTLVFVVMERFGAADRFLTDWSPRRLAPVRTPGRRRSEVVAEMVAEVAFVLWWTGLINVSALLTFPAALQVNLASVWSQMFWPILAYMVVEFGLNVLELARPGWTTLGPLLSLVKNLAGCVILVVLIRAGHWLDVRSPSWTPIVAEHAQQGFDLGMRIGLMVTAFILVCKAVADIWRLVQARGPGQTVGNGGSVASPV